MEAHMLLALLKTLFPLALLTWSFADDNDTNGNGAPSNDANDGGNSREPDGDDEDEAGDDGEQTPEFTQKDVDRIMGKTREEERERVRRQFLEEFGVDDTDALKESLTELQKLREERMSEEEKRQAEFEKLQQQVQDEREARIREEEKRKQREQENEQARIENAVLAAAAKANFADPADAVKFIDRSDIDLTDDGTVTGVDDAIDQLAKEKAYLLRRDANRIAGPTNPERGGDTSTTDEERRARYFPAAGRTKTPVWESGSVVSVQED